MAGQRHKNKKRPQNGSSSDRRKAAPSQQNTSQRNESVKTIEQRPARQGALPKGHIPLILATSGETQFRLLDSGHGKKLEQYGDYRIIRPEAQALWRPKLSDADWQNADAIFTGDVEEDGIGRWAFPKGALGETWPMRLMDVDFLGRFTAFRHVGVFPEQIMHWRWMSDQIKVQNEKRQEPVKVLNLFGYTGVASLIAAHAGAEVTHVDASKKAIGWARENQTMAGLTNKPIRWICDDAMKFIAREERRGKSYDIILTDPPKFGRGPNGEVWQLFDHLPNMLDICRSILSQSPIGLVLTAYSIRASFYAIHELMRETMRGKQGLVESGELVIEEYDGATDHNEEPFQGRALSTSLFSRWVPDEH